MNYLEKYLKYKSKYQQLKNQIGGAKLGDHTWIIGGDYWGIIVGYKSSDNTYVVLQKKNMHGFKEKFLRPENENKIWTVDNSIQIFNPSKKDIKDFIDSQRPLRSDVIWFNPEEETQPKISPRGAPVSSSSRGSAAFPSSPRGSAAFPSSPRGAAAFPSSPRGAAAFPSSPRGLVSTSRGATVVSSFAPTGSATRKLTLVELARTNTEFQNLIFKLKKSGILSILHDSDKFRPLLTDEAVREMDNYFMEGGPAPDWIRVGEEAIRQASSDRSADAIIATMQRRSIASNMDMYCFDCNKQVYLGTKCSETGMYHMGN